LARLGKLQRFRAAIDEVYRLRPGLQELTTAGTTVCRCEEVTASAVADALAGGAQSLNQVKAWTRAGMGSCQARMCATSITALAAAALGRVSASLPPFTPRPPIKPVPVAALINPSDADETNPGGN
jgi:bacterioferritin-associated ferredoxin